MQNLIFIVLLALMLSGCSPAERNKIVGVWTVETADKLSDRISGETENESMPAPTLEVHFQWSGNLKTVTRMGTINREKVGSWKLLNVEGDEFFLECTLGDSKMGFQTTELKIRQIDETTIRMTPPNMAGLTSKMNFKKK